jgi:hypothetical protein
MVMDTLAHLKLTKRIDDVEGEKLTRFFRDLNREDITKVFEEILGNEAVMSDIWILDRKATQDRYLK